MTQPGPALEAKQGDRDWNGQDRGTLFLNFLID